MKTASTATSDRASEVGVERHDYKVSNERVVRDHAVLFVRKAGVPCPDHYVAAAVEQERDWLDHVLVDEER